MKNILSVFTVLFFIVVCANVQTENKDLQDSPPFGLQTSPPFGLIITLPSSI